MDLTKQASAQPDSRRSSNDRVARLPDLCVVSLARGMTADGVDLPPGSRGTVVGAYRDGLAYVVELFRPAHAVVTIEAADLRRDIDR